MPQRRTRTGSTKASESASKASKNVALPMTRRARRCQRESGIASRRAMRSPCATSGTSHQLAKLGCDGVRALDRGEMASAFENPERRLRNRGVQRARHLDGGGVVLLADDNRAGHPQGRQVGAQINVAEQRARRRITVEIVADEHVGGALQYLGVTRAKV